MMWRQFLKLYKKRIFSMFDANLLEDIVINGSKTRITLTFVKGDDLGESIRTILAHLNNFYARFLDTDIVKPKGFEIVQQSGDNKNRVVEIYTVYGYYVSMLNYSNKVSEGSPRRIKLGFVYISTEQKTRGEYRLNFSMTDRRGLDTGFHYNPYSSKRDCAGFYNFVLHTVIEASNPRNL